MTVQTPTRIYSTNNFIEILLTADSIASRSPKFSQADFGLEVTEEELANELEAKISIQPLDQTTPQVDPDEFEILYHWFIS